MASRYCPARSAGTGELGMGGPEPALGRRSLREQEGGAGKDQGGEGGAYPWTGNLRAVP